MSDRSWMPLVMVCVIAALPAAPAWAQLALEKSFSSLCTDPNGGDIDGLRIKLTGPEAAPAVTFEEPEGALMAPIVATDVAYASASGKLTFVVPTEAGRLAFEGLVGATSLDGMLKRADGDMEAVHLPLDKGGDGETACPPPPDAAKP